VTALNHRSSALDVFGRLYLVAAVTGGAFFMFRNLQLVVRPTEDVAIKNFRASMLYLVIILSAIVADSVVPGL